MAVNQEIVIESLNVGFRFQDKACKNLQFNRVTECPGNSRNGGVIPKAQDVIFFHELFDDSGDGEVKGRTGGAFGNIF